MKMKGAISMEYEGLICRPPMERLSFMLPVAVGCSYNRCKFCVFFKHLRHRYLPLELIEAELRRVRDLGGNPGQVFLGDGNAFGMETPRLLSILERVLHYFPGCRTVNMDAAVASVRGKTDEELRQLKASGVGRLYLGIECGLDDVLDFMRKGHTTSEAHREIQRIREAGLSFNAHIMTGVAGAGRGLENAEKLAAFLNRAQPERVVNFSLFLHRSAPLYEDVLSGRFTAANEVECLMEAHRLLELLEVDSLYFDGFHDCLEFRVRGRLPQDREKMLRKLEDAIAFHREREPAVAYA